MTSMMSTTSHQRLCRSPSSSDSEYRSYYVCFQRVSQLDLYSRKVYMYEFIVEHLPCRPPDEKTDAKAGRRSGLIEL